MRKVIKSLVSCVTVVAIVTVSARKTYGYNYLGSATAYAFEYAENYNKSYPSFPHGDCTNFVSQAVKAGGISMVDSNPGGVAEDKPDAWYIKYVDGTWRYSKSWTVVNNLKKFFKNKKYATVKTFSQQNWELIYQIVEPGDVLQLDGKHSVMITEIGNRTYKSVKYCGHTSDVQNKSIQEFTKYANGYMDKDIVIIHFK